MLYTDTKPVLVKKKNKVKQLKDKFKELRVVIGLKIAGKNIDDLIFIKRLIDIRYKLKRHGLRVIDIEIFTEDGAIVDFKRR